MFLADMNLGMNVTFTGITIVFLMLILLVLIIMFFGLFSKTAKPKEPKVKKEKTVQPVAPAAVTPTVFDDDEIIAVIAAAVAAMYDSTGIKPVIKSVKPAQRGTRNAWAMAGIIQNTRAF